MPLDGFRILDWAGLTFGGLPPAVLGGLGVALLLVGVVVAVTGFRMEPTSWSLVGAGTSMVILTYFVVGAAITAAQPHLAGSAQVEGAAPRVVPAAVATMLICLALFAFRMALRAWSGEEAAGKLMALLLSAGALGGIFVGVQIVRGASTAPDRATAEDNDPLDTPSNDDAPARPRGVVGARHR